jgi:predicted pyridoxine 5'-phosphate oxidase superfamily flavin-nucleotide-binding protein
MSEVFHAGEIEVQRRAGVERMASRVGNSIHAAVPPVAEEFLAARRWVVLATTDDTERPWASVLSGSPGFVRVLNGGMDGSGATHPPALALRATPASGDPLAANLSSTEFVGLLAIDLATRRRMRVNARLTSHGDGAIVLRADQIYSNCPQYIQRRRESAGARQQGAPGVRHANALSASQRDWIAASDTFFIATVNPGEGADASHRGGPPGFVRVLGDRLVWPDYQGNMMFNTLGNITVFPKAGLLFPDFATGSTLQVTGVASIDWDAGRAAAVPGAQRLVELTVEEVVEIRGAMPDRLELVDYSPHLPGAT